MIRPAAPAVLVPPVADRPALHLAARVPLLMWCLLLPAILTAANIPGQGTDNEIVLRVDRYTFTKVDLDVIERNHFFNDWRNLMILRAQREMDPDAVSEKQVQAAELALERKAVRTLISNTMTAAEIDPDRYKEQYTMFGREYDRIILQQFGSIDDYMARNGWSREDVETERRSFVAGQLRSWVNYTILQAGAKVDETEVRAFYDKHHDLFRLEKGYKIRVLVLDSSKHPRDTNLYQVADNLRQQYLDGTESFENLVRKNSDEEITKQEDGLWKQRPTLSEALKHLSSDPDQWEWITSLTGQQINAQWISVAQQLDPSQRDRRISRVFTVKDEQKTWYCLLYLEAVRPARLMEYNEVPIQTRRELAQEHKSDREIYKWTAKKLANARIVYRGVVEPYSKFWDEQTDD